MAETTSRIVWIPEREACAEASGAVASGYYLILPKPSKAKRRKRSATGSVCLIGPVANFVTAKFLDTSALSLGLLAQSAGAESLQERASQGRAAQRGASRPLPLPQARCQGRALRRPAWDAWSSLASTA